MPPASRPTGAPPILRARLPQERIRRTYTWIAPTHDLMAWLTSTRARRLGLRWAGVRDGEHVLEVAVGTGLTFRRLLKANPSGRTVGIDRTPAMLRRARRRAQRVAHTCAAPCRYRLRLGDARALHFPDASFDCLVNSYMLDLLPEETFLPVLRAFRRVLRPGGRLVLMNMTHGRRRRERTWALLYRLWPPLLGGCRPVQAAPYLKAAGFRHVRRARVSQMAFPSEVVYGER